MQDYESVGAWGFGIFYDAVRTQITRTTGGMVLEEFQSPSNPAENSWNTLLHLISGTNGDIPWIELTMPRGTQRAILESLRRQLTIKTRVEECYDIVGVETQRFQCGGLIAHNCGYGMGHVKFAATCATWGQPITEELAKRAVDTYRATYGAVVTGWYGFENAAIECVKTRQSVACGRVRWSMDKRGTLLCTLPSGRNLSYPGAFLEYTDTPWGNRKLTLHFYAVDDKKRWSQEKTYGGKIIENITQAIARDLLAAAMLRCEISGFPVIFSVHDEIVADVKENTKTFKPLSTVFVRFQDGHLESLSKLRGLPPSDIVSRRLDGKFDEDTFKSICTYLKLKRTIT